MQAQLLGQFTSIDLVTLVALFEQWLRQPVGDLEEGTWAAWLYDLLKLHISEVLVGNPTQNLQAETISSNGAYWTNCQTW